MRIRRLLLFWFPLAALAGLLTFYGLPRATAWWRIARFSDPVKQACTDGKERLVLSDVAPFDWDQVVILPPFVSRPWSTAALGYSWPDYLAYPQLWGASRHAGFLFLKEGRIVRTQLHWRNHGEFPYPMHRLSRRAAVFHIQRGANGCESLRLTL